MNYDSSFLTSYPTSNLFSDDLIGNGNSSLRTFYTPADPYKSSSRLLSDEFLHNDMGYRSSQYQPTQGVSLVRSQPPMPDVREYSGSLNTSSNSNTASTHAHLIEEKKAQTTLWTHLEKPSETHHSTVEMKEKRSAQIPVKPERHPTPSALTKKVDPHPAQSSVEVHQWITEDKDPSPVEQHRTTQQREKPPLPVLPNLSKANSVAKPGKGKEDKAYETAFHMRHDAYFDSLFQGNFPPKPSNNQQNYTPRTKPPPIPIQKAKAPMKTPRYEPPSNTSKRSETKKTSVDSTTPRLVESHPTPRGDPTMKNTDERYREALQKFRADRAEQQQRETNESTAKRMDYGKYVRNASKDSLLSSAIKPLPWSDFMCYKKGNVYSLTKEEKKELHQLSKSYGERIRYRNFALNHGALTARAHFYSIPYPMIPNSNEEFVPPVDDEQQRAVSSSSSDRSSPTRTITPHSSRERTTDGADADISDFDAPRKHRKTLPHSTTTDESEVETNKKQRNANENLSTLREEEAPRKKKQ